MSDMANLSWAKDAAIALALDRLNQKRVQETGAEASSVRQSEGALVPRPGGTEGLTGPP
jgi:hypothetical protein